jgi:hypothetical protein
LVSGEMFKGMCSLERSLIKVALSFGALDLRSDPDKSRCPVCIVPIAAQV